MNADVEQLLKSRTWEYYLSRPFTLFGASLWHHWYDSPEAEAVLGIRCPDVLFIEEHPGVMRCYRPKEQLAALRAAVLRVQQNTPLVLKLLQKGHALNQQAIALLGGNTKLNTLKESVAFLIDLALHATVLPNQFSSTIATHAFPPEVLHHVETLRSTSHYPRIVDEVVTILARQTLSERGANPEQLSHLTYREVCEGKYGAAKERHTGKLIYAAVGDTETVRMVSGVDPYLAALEPELFSEEIRGRMAYRGKATGVVRIVNSTSPTGVLFNVGDILVSVSTTPALLPLMKQAGAIVTDEGGLTSHATILARELKKPTIIGTRNATRMLKDGDMVEVDAEKGIIKKV